MWTVYVPLTESSKEEANDGSFIPPGDCLSVFGKMHIHTLIYTAKLRRTMFDKKNNGGKVYSSQAVELFPLTL